MFAAAAAFELRQQLRAPVFWVTGVLFALLVFATVTVDTVQIGGRGGVHLNSPYALSLTVLVMGVFYMFVTTAFVAGAAVRDGETGFGPILQSTPITPAAQVHGRFAGAFAAAALGFLFIPAGFAAGTLAPWLDAERLGPASPADYGAAYIVWGLPTLFATSAFLYALATATRSMMATYVGVVVLLAAVFAERLFASRMELSAAGAWLDPFGLGDFAHATRYASTAEKNAGGPALTWGVLGPRLAWAAFGVLCLAAARLLFRPHAAPAERRGRGDAVVEAPPPTAPRRAAPGRGARTALAQAALRTRFEAGLVVRSPAFLVLLAVGLLNAALRLGLADGPVAGVPVHPVTRLMVEGLRESFAVIPLVVAVFYAGELVWRDRDRRLDEIVGATSAPDWTFALPKMLAVSLVLLALTGAGALAGVAVQLAKGGAAPDLAEYLVWFVLPQALTGAQVAVLAVFLQTIAPHKVVGWMLMIGVVLLITVGGALGVENDLLIYAATPPEPLSDMNGGGVAAQAGWWFRAYWTCVALVLAVLSHGLWRRGEQTALRPRLLRLPLRLGRGGAALLAAALGGAAAVGGFIFLNTDVWNTRTPRGAEERRLADMERTLRPFADLPQPKITAVSLSIDLRPRAASADIRGSYLVRNDTAGPVRELHLHTPRLLKVKALSVEGGRSLRSYERFDHRVFVFDTPMQPGETRRVSFETRLAQRGFRDGGDQTAVVADGSFFFDRDVAPGLGVDQDAFLHDRAKRRKFGLHPYDLRPPTLEDAAARRFNALRRDADFVDADVTVTTDADQTPVAPGYKVADVVAGGRRTARFRSEAPMLPVLAVQSARYAERRDRWRDVDLAVLHHPAHAWNADRMTAALKAGLDLYTAEFGPYQFRQVRVVEFPDYRTFAVSLPNTVPYSEGIGFIFKAPADPRRSGRLDAVTYVTAHELAHQWWAHQETPSAQQGAAMTTETLAQYSALLVLEHLYGGGQVRAALAYERDRYLRGRAAADRDELPLVRVENQPYIHYGKGALVMWRLHQELGEATVDRALRRFLAEFRLKGPPFARSVDLLRVLREEAGPDPRRQQLLTDLFERITFYDLRVRGAVAQRTPQGWVTRVRLLARKLQTDGRGVEREAPLDELTPVRVEVQGGPPVMARVRLTSGEIVLALPTASRPTRVEVGDRATLIERDLTDDAAPVVVRP